MASKMRQLVAQVAANQAGKDLVIIQGIEAVKQMAKRWEEESAGHLKVQCWTSFEGRSEIINIRVELLSRNPFTIFEKSLYTHVPNLVESMEESFQQALRDLIDKG